MDWSRIEDIERARVFANKLCLVCVGGAFACFVAIVAGANWVYGMSIAWGLIVGGVVCVILILLASVRIAVLQGRERAAPLDPVQRGSASDKGSPFSDS